MFNLLSFGKKIAKVAYFLHNSAKLNRKNCTAEEFPESQRFACTVLLAQFGLCKTLNKR